MYDSLGDAIQTFGRLECHHGTVDGGLLRVHGDGLVQVLDPGPNLVVTFERGIYQTGGLVATSVGKVRSYWRQLCISSISAGSNSLQLIAW